VSGVIIRNFTTTDQVAVNRVACAAWDQYVSIFEGWNRIAESLANTASLSSNTELVVAERAGLVVGVVGYVGPLRAREAIFPPDWAIVRMLSVLPTERGRGIGRMLTDACIERARRDRAATIGLHTTPVMRAALDLYLRMGFVRQKAIPDRFGVPYAVYTLTLDYSDDCSDPI
jgi:ribosomal protein S18 acetylase RimI-like enzyme